jgi:arylsulfatase A-like enzyme
MKFTTQRACLLIPLLLLGLNFAGRSGFAVEPSRKPNILILLADDMGFSDLGCYGSEIHTPNLDGLARNGLRFTQFYNTARCWPSRAALLTGYYAQQVRRDTVPGVASGGKGVRPAWAPLLPEMLRPLGYRNYHSGKWHVDGRPLENGFDHSYLLQDLGRYFRPRVHFKDDRKLPPVPPHPPLSPSGGEGRVRGADAGYYTTIAIADHAIECLKEHAEHFADKPFFQYVAFNAPHFPLQALPEDIARYRETYRRGWDVVRQERWKRMKKMRIISHDLPALERDVGPPYHFPEALKQFGPNEINRPLPWRELTEEQQAFQSVKMSIHAAMIDRLDREVGRILQQLRVMGALDNTLILVLSDNGASAEMMVRDDGHDPKAAPGSADTHLCLGPGWSSTANTPLRRHKTWVHEGGISTPLIVHWPKGISARGELRHNPGHLIDIVPTVLELAGGKRPEMWKGKPVPPPPGKSLVPVFARDNSVSHDYLWWCHEGNRAVRVGDWKLVAAGAKARWELYDLKTDRGESHNLADKRPEKVQELEAIWTQHFREFCELALKDAPAAPSPKKTK